ncbi:hypothetical protein TNCV_711891 [Trichonephila clavipes]|nr:hypothetical protein TNCV_711891 [Trichonephila clavipes]
MEGDEYMIPKHKQPDNPFVEPGDPRKRLDIKDVMVLNDIIEQAAGRQSKASERGSYYVILQPAFLGSQNSYVENDLICKILIFY